MSSTLVLNQRGAQASSPSMGFRSPLPELKSKSEYVNAHQIVLSTEGDDHLGDEHRLKGGRIRAVEPESLKV